MEAVLPSTPVPTPRLEDTRATHADRAATSMLHVTAVEAEPLSSPEAKSVLLTFEMIQGVSQQMLLSIRGAEKTIRILKKAVKRYRKAS